MIKYRLFLFSFILYGSLFFSCSSEKKGYVVKNPNDMGLKDKAVVLTRDEVMEYVTIPEGKVVIVNDAAGKSLPSQCDDIDGDGKWDELAFLVDIKAKENKKVFFKAVDPSEVPDFPKRTNIRFGDKKPPYKELLTAERLKTSDSPSSTAAFQMEGPAWENDIIGFRNYFDARNGMDIFGKQVSVMALDSVGLPGKPTYHELSDWGMDILKVGNSLGAGAIGLKVGDSIYHIGPTGEGWYRFITEGPVRAMFELTFKNAVIAGRKYDIKHVVSIYAGDNFYRSSVTVNGLQGDEKLITGIVNHDLPLSTGEFNGMEYFYTLGPQAFTHEKLGMALLVDKNVFAGNFSAPDSGDGITKTYVVSMNIENGKPVGFEFLAAWENQNAKYVDVKGFEELIKKSIFRVSLK